MKRNLTVISALLLSLAASFANSAENGYAISRATDSKALSGNLAMTEGEIRKIDKDGRKLTIKHGELKNLDMPAMTMVFRVKDPEMLNGIQVGDHVNFVAGTQDGQLVVVKIEHKK